MWVIEDYRDAPMVPIAIIANEDLARAFAESACGDNAHIYEIHLPQISEAQIDMRPAADDELDENRVDEAVADRLEGSAELDAMLYRMRVRPPTAANSTAFAGLEATPRRAAGAR